MTPPEKGNLPRLEKHFYQGHAVIFWTNTIEERARGWLTPLFHSTFREIMLHAAAREDLFCPAYCLMPDHLHLVTNPRDGRIKEFTGQLKAVSAKAIVRADSRFVFTETDKGRQVWQES